MPNYVLNKVTLDCSEERAKEIMEAVRYDPDPDNEEWPDSLGTFDFSKLIPMPSSLMIEAGSSTERGIEIYLTAVNPDSPNYGLPKIPKDEFNKLANDLNAESRFTRYKARLSDEEIQNYTTHASFEELANLGKVAVSNLINYGSITWYGWSLRNWGTKWNSCDSKRGDDNDHEFQFKTAWSAPHPVIEALAKTYPDVKITHEWADEDIGQNCGKCEYENGECVSTYEPKTPKEGIRFAAELWGYDPEEYYAELDASDCDCEEEEEEEKETGRNETEEEEKLREVMGTMCRIGITAEETVKFCLLGGVLNHVGLTMDEAARIIIRRLAQEAQEKENMPKDEKIPLDRGFTLW